MLRKFDDCKLLLTEAL